MYGKIKLDKFVYFWILGCVSDVRNNRVLCFLFNSSRCAFVQMHGFLYTFYSSYLRGSISFLGKFCLSKTYFSSVIQFTRTFYLEIIVLFNRQVYKIYLVLYPPGDKKKTKDLLSVS